MLKPTDEQRIQDKIAGLDEECKRLHIEALSEGYKDEICPECGTVLLSHHHLVLCESATCPMKAKGSDGKPAPSILQQLLVLDELEEEENTEDS